MIPTERMDMCTQQKSLKLLCFNSPCSRFESEREGRTHIVSRGFRRIFRLLFSVNPLLEERREVRCRNLLPTGFEEDLFCHQSIVSNISNLKSTHIIFTHIRLPHLPHLPHFIHPDGVCHLILTFSCKEKDEVKCTKIHGMTHRGRPVVPKPTGSDDFSSSSVNFSSLC